MSKPPDGRSPLTRAHEVAAGLKPGSWESVEALALLAIATPTRPERDGFLDAARAGAAGLKAGTWESVRALAWLARAEREVPHE